MSSNTSASRSPRCGSRSRGDRPPTGGCSTSSRSARAVRCRCWPCARRSPISSASASSRTCACTPRPARLASNCCSSWRRCIRCVASSSPASPASPALTRDGCVRRVRRSVRCVAFAGPRQRHRPARRERAGAARLSARACRVANRARARAGSGDAHPVGRARRAHRRRRGRGHRHRRVSPSGICSSGWRSRPGRRTSPSCSSTRVDEYLNDRRERGYYEARLAALPRFANEDRLVNISLDANQGPRVRIVFTGDQLPDDVRDELVPIAREGSTDEDLLEDSANRIRDYLHAQGYRDARVTHQRVRERRRTGGQLCNRAWPALPARRRSPSRATSSSRRRRWRRCCGSPPVSPSTRRGSTPTCRRSRSSTGGAVLPRRRSTRRSTPIAGSGADPDVTVGIRIVIVENAQTLVGTVRVEGNTSVAEDTLLAGIGLKPAASSSPPSWPSTATPCSRGTPTSDS